MCCWFAHIPNKIRGNWKEFERSQFLFFVVRLVCLIKTRKPHCLSTFYLDLNIKLDVHLLKLILPSRENFKCQSDQICRVLSLKDSLNGKNLATLEKERVPLINVCSSPFFAFWLYSCSSTWNSYEKRDTSAEGQEETCKKEVDNLLLLNC